VLKEQIQRNGKALELHYLVLVRETDTTQSSQLGNARAATMVYRFHYMAKQKPLHRKDRKLAGVLNMSAPFSLISRRAAKRTLNGKK